MGEFHHDYRHGQFEESYEGVRTEGEMVRDKIMGKISKFDINTNKKIFEGTLINNLKQGNCFVDDG